jgi:predicted transcriptional regulator
MKPATKDSKTGRARRSARAVRDSEFIKGVMEGLKQADRGEFVSAESLRAMVRRAAKSSNASRK